MLLSIIIPVYNIENYIGRCLDACLNQNISIDNYEIICVNDGSTDKSLEILTNYAGKNNNIKIIDKINEGVSIARNTGIASAQGEYIWFVDGDDWINADALEFINNKLTTLSTRPQQIVFNYRLTNDYINEKIDRDNCECVVSKDSELTPKKSYSNAVWCRWYKTEILHSNNLCFKIGMKYAEDTLFLTKYKLYCDTTLVIEAPMYYYFQRLGSAMKNIDIVEHSRCMLILNREYKRIIEKYSDTEVKKRMRNGFIRTMQVFCRNLCMYCGSYKKTKKVLSLLKKKKLYPFGIDKGNFRIDSKQSLKNDVLNWFFALLSFEPYFWLNWFICRIIFKNISIKDFDISVLQKELDEE